MRNGQTLLGDYSLGWPVCISPKKSQVSNEADVRLVSEEHATPNYCQQDMDRSDLVDKM